MVTQGFILDPLNVHNQFPSTPIAWPASLSTVLWLAYSGSLLSTPVCHALNAERRLDAHPEMFKSSNITFAGFVHAVSSG